MSNIKAQSSNKIQSPNDKIYDLEERTANFGEDINEGSSWNIVGSCPEPCPEELEGPVEGLKRIRGFKGSSPCQPCEVCLLLLHQGYSLIFPAIPPVRHSFSEGGCYSLLLLTIPCFV